MFDLEARVPTIFLITEAKIHDVNRIDAISYEPGSFFVVRAKSRLRYQHVSWKRRMPKNVFSDSIIMLTVYKSKHDYQAVLRKIEFYDEEQNRIFVFLTNALSLDALDVANLYKSRWLKP